MASAAEDGALQLWLVKQQVEGLMQYQKHCAREPTVRRMLFLCCHVEF